jgi:peroxidase
MQSGGPFFQVELGRLDGLSSTASSVPGQLPEPNQSMDQLLAVFNAHGLGMSDLVALSGPIRRACAPASAVRHMH